MEWRSIPDGAQGGALAQTATSRLPSDVIYRMK
jgi:hypothetical protein